MSETFSTEELRKLGIHNLDPRFSEGQQKNSFVNKYNKAVIANKLNSNHSPIGAK